MTKRKQSDRQAATRVKRLSPVTEIEQWPTVFQFGKAPVGVGYGDRAGDSAGVVEHGMPGKGWTMELEKPMGLSDDE